MGFEGHDVFEAGALESVDGLVVVSDDKEVGVFKKIAEEPKDFVLSGVGVLVFVDEDKLKFFLKIEFEFFVVFYLIDDLSDEVVKIVESLFLHFFFVGFPNFGELLHLGYFLFYFFLEAFFHFAFFSVLAVSFVKIVGIVFQAFLFVRNEFFSEFFWGYFFSFHLRKGTEKGALPKVVVSEGFEVLPGFGVDDFAEGEGFLEVVGNVFFGAALGECSFFVYKFFWIGLHDVFTEGVEGTDFYSVGEGSDPFLKSFSHFDGAAFSEGETENVFGVGVGLF